MIPMGSGGVGGEALKNSLNFISAPPFTEAEWKYAKLANAPAGDNEIYTCPTTRRAVVLYSEVLNLSGSTITYFQKLKRAGSSYRLGTNATVNANSAGFGFTQVLHFLDGGDTFVVNTSGAGANLFARVIEYAPSHPLKAARLFNPAAGDQILYQCPPGTRALLCGQSPTNPVAQATANWAHDSGASRAAKFLIAPAGTPVGGANPALGSDYQIGISLTGTSGQVSSVSVLGVLEAGDMFVFNVDQSVTGGHAFTHVLELPA